MSSDSLAVRLLNASSFPPDCFYVTCKSTQFGDRCVRHVDYQCDAFRLPSFSIWKCIWLVLWWFWFLRHLYVLPRKLKGNYWTSQWFSRPIDYLIFDGRSYFDLVKALGSEYLRNLNNLSFASEVIPLIDVLYCWVVPWPISFVCLAYLWYCLYQMCHTYIEEMRLLPRSPFPMWRNSAGEPVVLTADPSDLDEFPHWVRIPSLSFWINLVFIKIAFTTMCLLFLSVYLIGAYFAWRLLFDIETNPGWVFDPDTEDGLPADIDLFASLPPIEVVDDEFYPFNEVLDGVYPLQMEYQMALGMGWGDLALLEELSPQEQYDFEGNLLPQSEIQSVHNDQWESESCLTNSLCEFTCTCFACVSELIENEEFTLLLRLRARQRRAETFQRRRAIIEASLPSLYRLLVTRRVLRQYIYMYDGVWLMLMHDIETHPGENPAWYIDCSVWRMPDRTFFLCVLSGPYLETLRTSHCCFLDPTPMGFRTCPCDGCRAFRFVFIRWFMSGMVPFLVRKRDTLSMRFLASQHVLRNYGNYSRLRLMHDIETNPGEGVLSKMSTYTKLERLDPNVFKIKSLRRLKRRCLKCMYKTKDKELKSLLNVLLVQVRSELVLTEQFGVSDLIKYFVIPVQHSVSPELGNVLASATEALNSVVTSIHDTQVGIDEMKTGLKSKLDVLCQTLTESAVLRVVLLILSMMVKGLMQKFNLIGGLVTKVWTLVEMLLTWYMVMKFGPKDPMVVFAISCNVFAAYQVKTTMEYQVRDDLIAMSIPEHSFRTFGKGLLGVLYFIAYQKHADDSSIFPMLKEFGNVDKYQKGAMGVLDYMFDLLSFFSGYVSETLDITGCIKKDSLFPEMDALGEQVSSLVDRFRAPGFPIDADTCQEVFNLEKNILRLKHKELPKDVKYNDCRVILTDWLSAIRAITTKLSAWSRSERAARVETSNITFCGETGVGKTTAMELLINEVTPWIIPLALCDQFINNPESIVYTFNAEDEYWSGLWNHLVLRLDELGAMTEAEGGQDVNRWLQYLFIMSAGPFPTNQPDVVDKGSVMMRALLMVCGTNMMNVSHIKSLLKKAAIVRRTNAVCLYPLPEFATPETRHLPKHQRKLDYTLFDPAVPFSTDVWRWDMLDFETGLLKHGWREGMMFQELIDFTIAQVKRNKQKFDTNAITARAVRTAAVAARKAMEPEFGLETPDEEFCRQYEMVKNQMTLECPAFVAKNTDVLVEESWISSLRSGLSKFVTFVKENPVLVGLATLCTSAALFWPFVRQQFEEQSGKAVRGTKKARRPKKYVPKGRAKMVKPAVAHPMETETWTPPSLPPPDPLPMEMQALSITDGHFALAHRLMANNVLSVRIGIDPIIAGFVIVASGYEVLSACHMFGRLEDEFEKDSNVIVSFQGIVSNPGKGIGLEHGDAPFSVMYKDIRESFRDWAETREKDLCMFTLPPVTYPRKSILRMLPDSDNGITEFWAVLATPLTSMVWREDPELKIKYQSQAPNGGYVLAPVWCAAVKDAKYGDMTDTLVYAYDKCTYKGFCIVPLFRADSSSPERVEMVGFHVAGNGSKGFSTAINRDMVKDLMHDPEEQPLDGADALPFETEFYAPTNIPVLGEFVGTVNEAPSRIRPSSLSKYLDVEPAKIPSLMRSRRVEEGVVCPKYNSMEPYNKNSRPVNMELLDDITAAYKARVVRVSKPMDTPPRVFTAIEAIQGVPGLFPGLEDTKSPGLPWVLRNLKRRDIWGDREARDFTTPLALELLAEVESVEKRFASGDTTLLLAIDKLKSETLKRAKVKLGKTRLYRVFPLAVLIVLRMYYMDATLWFQNNKIVNGCTIGVNPMSEDWTVMGKYITEVGPKVLAGDFKEWDGRLLSVFINRAFQPIHDYYSNATPFERAVREGVVKAMSCCRFVSLSGKALKDVFWSSEKEKFMKYVDGEEIPLTAEELSKIRLHYIYRLTSGMPSGIFLTGLVNSIANILKLHYAAVGAVIGDSRDYRTELHFVRVSDVFALIRVVTHGDDNLVGVGDALADSVDQHTMTRQLEIIGDEYTDEMKLGRVIARHRTIGEVSFLKRMFEWCTKRRRFLAPIELLSILNPLLWVNGSEKDIDMRNKVGDCVAQLSLRSVEEFELWNPQIRTASLKALNWVPEWETRKQCQARALSSTLFY